MKRLVPATLAAALLVIPAIADGKGTNVRLDSAPNGHDAGEAWRPLITITMPGNGPLARLHPAVVIRHGDVRKRFAAHATRRRGVYSATVTFPARGRWRYGVDDGFDSYEHGAGRVHGFPAVTIGPDVPAQATPPKPISGEIEVEPQADPNPPFHYPAPSAAKEDEDDDDSRLVFIPAFLVPLAAGALAVRRRRASRAGTS